MNKLLVGMAGLVAFMVILLPGLVALLMEQSGGGSGARAVQTESPVIHVYLHEEDRVEKMMLEEYVKGVLSAEMPAAFETEALKAQAVAARTYAVKHMRSFGGSGVEEQPEADVSTDFTKDQSWLGAAALRERWGANYAIYWRKISQAVEATRGQILLYENQPISALFHSMSAERTASAKEAWGYDFPYLQSVPCSWDAASPRYRDKKAVPIAALGAALGEDAGAAAALQSGDNQIVKVLSLTESGRVKEIRIGSKTFSGQEVRQRLGLRSENFTAEHLGDQLIFHTLGYGHGVGLCQYGANGMAKEGRKYSEILSHYYTGVELSALDQL